MICAYGSEHGLILDHVANSLLGRLSAMKKIICDNSQLCSQNQRKAQFQHTRTAIKVSIQSVRLFSDLHSRSTNVCGTARRNRIPTGIREKRLQKGESFSLKRGELLCTKFADKKDMYMLSTFHESNTVVVHRRGRGRDGQNIVNKPTCIVRYNQNMGAVDKVDQMMQPYTFVRKSLKWYRKLAMHLLQVASLNAFIIYSMDNPALPNKQYFEILE